MREDFVTESAFSWHFLVRDLVLVLAAAAAAGARPFRACFVTKRRPCDGRLCCSRGVQRQPVLLERDTLRDTERCSQQHCEDLSANHRLPDEMRRSAPHARRATCPFWRLARAHFPPTNPRLDTQQDRCRSRPHRVRMRDLPGPTCRRAQRDFGDRGMRSA